MLPAQAATQGWFFSGFMSLVHFGPFEEIVSSDRCLDSFPTKEPPAAMKKQSSRSAQRKRVAVRESSAHEADPQHGATSKDLIERKKLLLKEATIELQAQSFDEKLKEQRDQQPSDEVWGREKGLQEDFQAIDRAWQHWDRIWERISNNDFAMEKLKDLAEERLQAKAALEQCLSNQKKAQLPLLVEKKIKIWI